MAGTLARLALGSPPEWAVRGPHSPVHPVSPYPRAPSLTEACDVETTCPAPRLCAAGRPATGPSLGNGPRLLRGRPGEEEARAGAAAQHAASETSTRCAP